MFRMRRPMIERSVPLALIAFALFLRLLVPAGWMPTEEGFGIRPCVEAATAVEQVADAPAHAHAARHHKEPLPEDEQQAQPCSFTALASPLAFAPPASDAPPAIVPTPARPQHARTAVRLPPRLAAPPPPQTGPPVFA